MLVAFSFLMAQVESKAMDLYTSLSANQPDNTEVGAKNLGEKMDDQINTLTDPIQINTQ
jgi:hypothetical protein